MADVTPQAAAVTGTVLTANAAADPITFDNNGRTMRLIAVNSSGATRTFDIVTTQQIEGDLDVDDRSFSIPSSQTYTYIGAFPAATYNDGSDELTIQNFNATTGLTFLALQD